MFLKSHPDRGKSQEERNQIERRYAPGENVTPRIDISHDQDDSDEERLLENARELSLQDINHPISTSRPHGRPRRRHDQQSDSRSHSRYRPDAAYGSASPRSPRARQPLSPLLTQDRHLDHQSSLRSLVSASEPDSLEIQEEIMQQILTEGLLDHVDLNNLTPAQEEEITETIARAFRNRHADRQRRRPRRNTRTLSPSADYHATASAARSQDNSTSLSHSRLPDQPGHQSRRHRPRTSSQSSAPSSSAVTRSHDFLAPSHPARSASRSANDVSTVPYAASSTRLRQSSSSSRRSVEPYSRTNSSQYHHAGGTSSRPSSQREVSLPSPPSTSGVLTSSTTTRSENTLLALRSEARGANSSSPALVSAPTSLENLDPDTRPATASAALSSPPSPGAIHPAPSVGCSRCEKSDIQFSLHYHCSQCSSGQFNLCLSCYRAGMGCFHWFGFGYAAPLRYQQLVSTKGYPHGLEKPHVLTARRYQSASASLDEGLFCEGCFAFADECYWHCNLCNDGAWGFCNDCVQQAKNCAHGLHCVGSVPRGSVSQTSDTSHAGQAPRHVVKSNPRFAPSSFAVAMPRATLPNDSDGTRYVSLTLAVSCDLCHRSIPPSDTRLHCHVCNLGNYDICTPCYHALASSGKVSPENGIHGWRRCPQGHRMSIVGFEDREGGSRRVVVRDFVGGWALKEVELSSTANVQNPTGKWKWKEEDGTPAFQTSTTRNATTKLMPPDGGVGLRTQALWSRFPPPGVQDELTFPRNAIISEVENINGDWYWGVYAGKKGLFPGNFVRVLQGLHV